MAMQPEFSFLIELFKDEILPYINITGEKGGERTFKLYIATFITPKGVIPEKGEIQTKNTGFPSIKHGAG